MTEIGVGDIVRITDPGRIYPSYTSFYADCGFGDLERRHKREVPRYTNGTVLFHGYHAFGSPVVYALEVEDDGGGIVLVGEAGVELVDKKFDLPPLEVDVNEAQIYDFIGVKGGIPCR